MRTKNIQNIVLQQKFGAPRAQRAASARPNPAPPSASRPRPMKAAAKAAALVRTNAAAANVLIFVAAAALSVATRRASDLTTMQRNQTQVRRQERFCQSLQQHHQMRRALPSCINRRTNCRHRQLPYRIQQPPAMEHSTTTTSRVRFHKAIVTHLRVYNPGKPAAAAGPSMCADSGCSTILVTECTAKAIGLLNTGPSKVTVQVASGHINRAIHDTTVPLDLGGA